MNKNILFLAALLVAQLGLAAYVQLGSETFGASKPGDILIAIEGDSPDKLSIESEEGDALALVKQGDDWILPGYFDAPVSDIKLNALMTKLAGLRPRHPVANTEAAAERFKVAKGDYKTHLSLIRDGESVAELFAGDSPGYRRSYVRVGGEQAIYDAEIPSTDLSAKPVDWLDRGLYHLNLADIEWVEVAGVKLKREGEAWVAEGLPEGQVVDQATAQRMQSQVTTIQISEILGTEAKPEYKLDEAEIAVSVKLKDQEPIRIVMASTEGDAGDWIMKASNKPYYVKLPGYVGKPFAQLTRETLISDGAQAEQ